MPLYPVKDGGGASGVMLSLRLARVWVVPAAVVIAVANTLSLALGSARAVSVWIVWATSASVAALQQYARG